VSDQGGPGRPWYRQPLYGDPQYPPEAGPPYPPPPYPPPLPGYSAPHDTVRGRTGRWLTAGIALLAVLGVALYLALSGGASEPKRALRNPPVVIPSVVIPSIVVPSIAVPPVTIPSFPQGVPSDLVNPCGFATSAFAAATTYVGLAEIGETGFAQACVYKNTVASSVTASIDASGTALYSPTGNVSGSTTEFGSIDGTTTLEVTATKKRDGKYWITKVERR
jgi:hypothetical protein